MRQPASAGDLVDKLLKGLGIDERLQQYKALVIWNEVVGPQIAARTRPVRIRDDILEVNVDQPAWMQQLQLMKPKILARLNAELEGNKVRDLFLKRGRINQNPEKPPEQPPAWRTVQLDTAEKQQVADLLSTVDDPELRDQLERFLTKQMRVIKAEERCVR
jgi:hypothetical protein